MSDKNSKKNFWEDNTSKETRSLLSCILYRILSLIFDEGSIYFIEAKSHCTKGERALVYSGLYIVVLLGFLSFAFICMFDLRQYQMIGRLVFIIVGLVFSFLPRFYWWHTCNQFEKWIIEDKHKIDDRRKTRDSFFHTKEFALSFWIAILAVFTVLVTQGTFYPETTFNYSYRGEERYYYKCGSAPELYKTYNLLNKDKNLFNDLENKINNSIFISVKLTGLLSKGVAQISSLKLSSDEVYTSKKRWVKSKFLTINKPNC